MDLSTAERIASRYLPSTVVVLLCFGPVFLGGCGFLWHEHEALLQRNDQLRNEKLNLAKKQLDLEKRDFIMQQRETQLLQREKDLASQAAIVQQGVVASASTASRLGQEESRLSLASRQKQAEDHIQQLMAQFSELGVRLGQFPYCDDPDGIRRYHAALTKYNQIAGLAQRNGLFEQYGHFFTDNSIRLGRLGDCEVRQ
jgi:hypothetical protein